MFRKYFKNITHLLSQRLLPCLAGVPSPWEPDHVLSLSTLLFCPSWRCTAFQIIKKRGLTLSNSYNWIWIIKIILCLFVKQSTNIDLPSSLNPKDFITLIWTLLWYHFMYIRKSWIKTQNNPFQEPLTYCFSIYLDKANTLNNTIRYIDTVK